MVFSSIIHILRCRSTRLKCPEEPLGLWEIYKDMLHTILQRLHCGKSRETSQLQYQGERRTKSRYEPIIVMLFLYNINTWDSHSHRDAKVCKLIFRNHCKLIYLLRFSRRSIRSWMPIDVDLMAGRLLGPTRSTVVIGYFRTALWRTWMALILINRWLRIIIYSLIPISRYFD